jgi:predicted anti-sigma-YlaC factor YlaD
MLPALGNGACAARSLRFARSCGLCLAVMLGIAASGCSVRQLAVESLGDALAAGGAGFATDEDPELVGAAAPFSLKLIESLLAEAPRHRGLLLAAAQGFAQFAYAYVELRADELEDSDLVAARLQRDRARALYLRARDYGLRGLEVAQPRIAGALRSDPAAAAGTLQDQDLALAYWTAVAWAAAISLSKDDPFLVAELPAVEALARRALALDEAYGDGAIHTFLISYEMARAGHSADAPARASANFARAVELSGGFHAAPYVAFAEAVSVAERDRAGFDALLQRALRIDAGARPQWRLANSVLQRRARWLLARTDRYFSD